MRIRTVIETGSSPRLRIRVDGLALYEVKVDGRWFEVGRDTYLAVLETLKVKAVRS